MTDIFENDFEENDFSAYTDTTIDSGQALTVETEMPLKGSYSVKMILDGLQTDVDVYARKTFSASNPLYARVYVYLSAFTGVEGYTCGLLSIGPWQQARVACGMLTRQLGLMYRTDAGAVHRLPKYYLALNRWYCLAVGYYAHATEGWVKLWLDGELIDSVANLDNDEQAANLNEVKVGNFNEAPGPSVTAYLELVKVANEYIPLWRRPAWSYSPNSGL